MEKPEVRKGFWLIVGAVMLGVVLAFVGHWKLGIVLVIGVLIYNQLPIGHWREAFFRWLRRPGPWVSAAITVFCLFMLLRGQMEWAVVALAAVLALNFWPKRNP
jgi:hypothetical protein